MRPSVRNRAGGEIGRGGWMGATALSKMEGQCSITFSNAHAVADVVISQFTLLDLLEFVLKVMQEWNTA